MRLIWQAAELPLPRRGVARQELIKGPTGDRSTAHCGRQSRLRDLVATVAKATGYSVLELTDSTLLEGTLGSWSPTHVLIDLNMPTIDGIAALQILARHHSPAKIVICSGAAGDF